jgi:hypothetical protein
LRISHPIKPWEEEVQSGADAVFFAHLQGPVTMVAADKRLDRQPEPP